MFIVLEKHGGPEYAIVCINENGENLVFNTEEEAVQYASENCQEGIVVEI